MKKGMYKILIVQLMGDAAYMLGYSRGAVAGLWDLCNNNIASAENSAGPSHGRPDPSLNGTLSQVSTIVVCRMGQCLCTLRSSFCKCDGLKRHCCCTRAGVEPLNQRPVPV